MTKIAQSRIKVNAIYKKYGSSYKGRYLFTFGGAGSGKSFYDLQNIVKRIVQEDGANHKILMIRKVARTLKESVYDLVKAIFQDTGFDKFCHFKYSQGDNYIEFKPNGNKLVFLGLDDPEKIKSINGVTSIFIEEITELTEQDFLQLDLRLRGETKYKKQIVAAFNPVSKDHWLLKHVEPQLYTGDKDNIKDLKYLEGRKVWEFNTVAPNGSSLQTRVINTTFEDNRFLDDAYVSRLETLASVDEVYYTVYKLGRWGRIIDGTQYISTFKESLHIANLNGKIDDNNTLHYTVDFNVDPYMSGIVMQLEYVDDDEWNGFDKFYNLRVFKEYKPKGNEATAYSLGSDLATDPQTQSALELGFFLYGDASGRNRSGIKDTKNLFQDLKRGLGELKYKVTERIPTSNPRYKRIAPKSLGRRAFVNLLFSGKLPVRIQIDKDCHELINDLKYCTTDTNGAKEKKKTKGIELRGHMLDAFEYFICHPKTLGHLAVMK